MVPLRSAIGAAAGAGRGGPARWSPAARGPAPPARPRDRDQLAGERDEAQRERQRGGRAGADGGAERDDERALAQPEPAGRERDEDAEQPRQREGAQEQEGVEAGGRAERAGQRPGAEAGGDPARGVEGDHRASVRPRSGPAVSIPRARRRSCSQPPTKAGRAATAATSAAAKRTMASTGG